MQKWAARFDLGLSPSVPVVEFEPCNIIFIDDDCELNLEFLHSCTPDNVAQMHLAMIPEMARPQQRRHSLMGVVI